MREMEDRMQKQSLEYAAGRADLAEEQRKCVQDMKDDGNKAFKAGHIAKAVEHYSEALQMDRQCGNDDKVTAVLYGNRAAAYLKQAEVGHDSAWEDAERDCRRALERAPSAKIYVRCARALSEGLGRPMDAFVCLAEALALEPTNSVVREAVAKLREEHADLVAPEAVLTRLRRRQAQRLERSQEKEAAAYGDAVALLVRQP